MSTRKRYQKLIQMFRQNTTKPWNKFNQCITTTVKLRMNWPRLWIKFTHGNQNMKLWKDPRNNNYLSLKGIEKKITPEQMKFRNMRKKTDDSGNNLTWKKEVLKINTTILRELKLLISRKFLAWDTALNNFQAKSENTLKSMKNVMTWRWKLEWPLSKSKDLTEFSKKEMLN